MRASIMVCCGDQKRKLYQNPQQKSGNIGECKQCSLVCTQLECDHNHFTLCPETLAEILCDVYMVNHNVHHRAHHRQSNSADLEAVFVTLELETVLH